MQQSSARRYRRPVISAAMADYFCPFKIPAPVAGFTPCHCCRRFGIVADEILRNFWNCGRWACDERPSAFCITVNCSTASWNGQLTGMAS